MKYCKNCAHAIFTPVWGVFKCSISEVAIYNDTTDCADYEAGKPSISKETPEGYEEEE